MASASAVRKIVVKSFGGPEQLTLETEANPLQAGPGQLLVDVEASGVNFYDVYQRSGTSIHHPSLPFTPGREGVGRIRAFGDEVDPNVDGLQVGSRVAWINVPESYAS